MNKINILNYLKSHKKDFLTNYKISKIGLFGSFATQTNTEKSDVDIVYETHSKGLTFSQLLQLEEELIQVFDTTIDLVNIKYMNPLVKREAIKDIIYV